MVYHPRESWRDPGQAWDSETVLFFTRDRTWRRLNLEDLGLPADAWPGPDTYGAGKLSPNGRWWAAKSDLGIMLLNLTTGRVRLVELPEPRVAQLTWLPNCRSLVAFYGDGAADASVQISVPDLTMTPVHYQQYQVGFEPNGTPVSVERTGAGARLVAWSGSRKTVRGPVPAWLVRNRLPQRVVASQESYLAMASDRWMSDDVLLLNTANHVFAWRPGEQRLYRVTDIPAGDGYWTADFAPDAAR